MPRVQQRAVPLQDADRLIRAGRLSDVLAENDRLVLQKGLGLLAKECTVLRRIWERMRDRRVSRRRAADHL